MLVDLAVTDFVPLVGTAFTAGLPGGPLPFELLRAEPLGKATDPPAPRPFALVFRAPTADLLPQGVFALAHDRLGRLDVFLVPVGRDPGGLLLEAIFT